MTSNFEGAALALGYSIVASPVMGSSSRVYRARHDGSGDHVALKVLVAGRDADNSEREAAVLSTIYHPGMAKFRDDHIIAGERVLVFDWIEGETLAEFIDRRGVLSLDEAMHLVDQLAATLDTVHSAGVVHGDLHPAQIVAEVGSGPRPTLKIIDFGVGRPRRGEMEILDRVDATAFRYMAPEMIIGSSATPHTDQYAVAVLLHELLTGSPPIAGFDGVDAFVHHLLLADPTPIRTARPSLPESVEVALLRALSKEPEHRFPSLNAFVSHVRGPQPAPTSDASSAKARDRSDSARKSGKAEGAKRPRSSAKRVSASDAKDPKASNETADETTPSRLLEVLKAASAVVLGIAIGVLGYLGFLAADDSGTREVAAPTTLPESTIPDSETIPVAAGDSFQIDAWEAGFAGSLQCNLITEPGFEQGEFPTNFYVDADNPDRERIVRDAGVDGSHALEIGDPGMLGAYGEVVPIEQDVAYFFSFNSRIAGDVSNSVVWVEWLDANMEVIEQSNSLNLLGLPDGQHGLATSPAPESAIFAVPRIFKDDGPGVLFIDELVFAPSSEVCVQAVLG